MNGHRAAPTVFLLLYCVALFFLGLPKEYLPRRIGSGVEAVINVLRAMGVAASCPVFRGDIDLASVERSHCFKIETAETTMKETLYSTTFGCKDTRFSPRIHFLDLDLVTTFQSLKRGPSTAMDALAPFFCKSQLFGVTPRQYVNVLDRTEIRNYTTGRLERSEQIVGHLSCKAI